jgi:hypothetical protein
VLVALAVFVFFTRDFWSTTIRSYFIGRLYVAGLDYGRFLPPVDEIEILALGGEVAKGTPDSFRPDLGSWLGTVNRHTVSGAEAEALASLWRSIDFDKHYGAICHVPYYALRFRHHGKLILETSVCWKCSNVTVPVFFANLPYGFDATSAEGQKLLAELTRYAPHPEAAAGMKR